MKQPSERPARKPYKSPKLLVYGDLTKMTKSAGPKANPDGGTVFRKRRTGR
jgi:hypothetical protein